MSVSASPSARSYRSSVREARARQTRSSVVDAARSVFLQRGYGGATVRAISVRAGVSVATVELLFGTKARLLKAAIDIAIAGDDDDAPMLDRAWTAAATSAADVEGFLEVVAEVVGPAQQRSAGLVLAVFEGSPVDAELADLAAQMIAQRKTTAEWIVDALTAKAPLRADLTRCEAVETLWVLMDPAVFDRLVRHRDGTVARYQSWFARSARCLLIADASVEPTSIHEKDGDMTRTAT